MYVLFYCLTSLEKRGQLEIYAQWLDITAISVIIWWHKRFYRFIRVIKEQIDYKQTNQLIYVYKAG